MYMCIATYHHSAVNVYVCMYVALPKHRRTATIEYMKSDW